MVNPRYAIATIVTKDIKLVERAERIRQNGFTHEDIYLAGVEALENVKMKKG